MFCVDYIKGKLLKSSSMTRNIYKKCINLIFIIR